MCKAGGYDGVALVPAAEDDPQHLAAVVLVHELHPLVQARAVVLLQDVGAVDRPVPPAEGRQEVVRVPSGQAGQAVRILDYLWTLLEAMSK